MRPLLVLILVIAALTAFFFAFNPFGEKDGGGAPGLSADATAAEPVSLEPGTELVATEPDARRTETPALAATDDRTAVAPEEAGSNALVGKVVDEAGEPVEAAEVTLTRFGRTTLYFVDSLAGDRTSDRVAATDEEGIYRFANVEPFDGYALIVTHPDYSTTEMGQVNVLDTGTSTEPPITLRPGVRVFGFVQDTAGNAIAGAALHLGLSEMGIDELPTGPDAKQATSSTSGEYEFANVAIGQASITVLADGYGRLTLKNINVTGSEDVERNVTLEVAHMIAGRVTAEGGAPVKGAKIQAYSTTTRGRQQTRSQAETNGSGEFTFEDVPEGTYMLIAQADGFEMGRSDRVQSGNMAVQIELTAKPTVSGRVLDKQTGNPLTRFVVQLRAVRPNTPDAIPEPETRIDVENANGEYKIFSRPGTWQVEALSETHAGAFSTTFTLEAGQHLEGVDVHPSRGGILTGRIVDTQGNPVARARVDSHDDDWTDDPFMRMMETMLPTVASTRTVRTKKDGTFEIQALTQATYRLDINHKDYSQAFKKGILVEEGQSVAVGDIRMSVGGTVFGTVLDPSGLPLPGGVVQLQADIDSMGSPASYTAKTDAEGAYRLAHVCPGAYLIKAMRSAEASNNPFANIEDIKVTQTRITVAENQEVRHDFNLGKAGEDPRAIKIQDFDSTGGTNRVDGGDR